MKAYAGLKEIATNLILHTTGTMATLAYREEESQLYQKIKLYLKVVVFR